jgi:hypothetical protein
MRASVAMLAPGVKWWGMRHRVSAQADAFSRLVPCFMPHKSRHSAQKDQPDRYELALPDMKVLRSTSTRCDSYGQANELVRLTHASR